MISKEILSEVFGREVTNIEKGCTENELKIGAYFGVARQSFFINIYELAHKCKEWALSKQYSLHSGYDKLTNKYGVYINLSLLGDDEETIGGWDTEIYFIADTEVETIFKACQWILDNKDLKC